MLGELFSKWQEGPDSAEGKIDRKDDGITFSMLRGGKLIVSEEIHIQIEGEIVEQKHVPSPDTASA